MEGDSDVVRIEGDSDVVRMDRFRWSQNGRIQMLSEWTDSDVVKWMDSDVVRMDRFRCSQNGR